MVQHRKLGMMLLAAAAITALVATTDAATYYLKSGAGSTNWGITSDWTLNSDGTGANPATMAGNDFSINAHSLGTPSGSVAFPGTSLDTAGGTLNLRNGGTKTVATMSGSGTSTITANQSGTVLSVTTFTANTGSTTKLVDTTGTTGSAVIWSYTFSTLVGSGNFELSASNGVNPGGSRIFVLTATTASAYTGTISWSGTNTPALQFGNDASFGGGLIATDAASRITLDKNVTFASVTLNGTSLSPGTYSFATLNTAYDTIFNDGGSGSITVLPVPEPASIALLAVGGLLLARTRKTRA